QSDASTEAVFWFSGHGSRIPDASGKSGAERNGLDSSYVAHDSRKNGARESFDLSDDELYSLVRALAARTSRITILTDSCHSGGGMRGLAPKTVRSAEHGGRPITAKSVEAFWPHDVEFLDDGDPRRLPFPYVHLAACAEDELANEASDDGETVFGAFTY